MSKKIICIILTFVLLVSLCACGKKDKTDANTNNSNNQTQQSQEVVIKEKVLEIEKVYERVIYEDSYTRVSIKSHHLNLENPDEFFSIVIGVQNKSNGNVNVEIETESINGVPAVKKFKQTSNDNVEKLFTANFVTKDKNLSELENVKTVEDVDSVKFKLLVYNSKNTNQITNEIEYFPNDDDKNIYELVLDEKTPVANDRCQVSYMATRTVNDKLHIIIYLENKTNKEMNFVFKNIFVGNEKIKEEFTKTVGAGMTSYSTIIIQVDEKTLKEAKQYTIQVSIPSEEENVMLISKPISFPLNKS